MYDFRFQLKVSLLLQGLTDLYILLSSDAIYDVAKGKDDDGLHISEHEMVRPDEEHERDERRFYFLKAHQRRVRNFNSKLDSS